MPGNIAEVARNKKAEAVVSMNLTTESGVSRKDIVVILRTTEGQTLVTPHPNSTVDVAGVELPPETLSGENTTNASQLNIIPKTAL